MADTYDIVAQKGDSLSLTLNLKDDNGNALNLSGFSVLGEVKYRYGETGILTNLNPIIVSDISGQILVSVPASGTQSLPIGAFPYNIFIVSGAITTNVLNGQFNVNPTVYGDI